MSIRFVALHTDCVRALQGGGPDANGHTPERHISDGTDTPCRHCLKQIKAGESYLILAHRPFPAAQPYAEQGPIFLHERHCLRYASNAGLPQDVLNSAHYMLRGYDAHDRIVYGSGRMVATRNIAREARHLLADPRIVMLHVRSATNNCYLCRIERT